MNIGAGGCDAVTPQRKNVTHFVDVDREYESQREFPTEHRPVHAEERDHAQQSV